MEHQALRAAEYL